MRSVLIAILVILALIPTWTVTAQTEITLEQRVAELELRVEHLEVLTIEPQGTSVFSGQCMSQTTPFTVQAPFEIVWSAQHEGEYGTTLIVTVVYPDTGTTAQSFGWYIKSGNSSGQTWCYVEPGTYYLSINTSANWTVEVK